MKKIEAIIKPHALEAVRDALNKAGVAGMTIYEVRGYGGQEGHTELYRGAEYVVDYLPRVKIETITTDDKADKLVEVIAQAAKTGKVGDGKIFVFEVAKALRIRTGETDEKAI